MTTFTSAHALRVKANKASERANARQFVRLCERVGLPAPQLEYTFTAPRKWRFDFAWPDDRIALESEGGVWSQGAHTRGKHFLSDLEKYNHAASLGWIVFRTVPRQLLDYSTLKMIASALDITLPEFGAL